jgi:hypothetical protein
MAPPLAESFAFAAWLPLNVSPVRLSWALRATKTAPPLVALPGADELLPPVRTKLSIVALAPGRISKSRVALPPLTVMFAPVPSMVTLLLRLI